METCQSLVEWASLLRSASERARRVQIPQFPPYKSITYEDVANSSDDAIMNHQLSNGAEMKQFRPYNETIKFMVGDIRVTAMRAPEWKSEPVRIADKVKCDYVAMLYNTTSEKVAQDIGELQYKVRCGSARANAAKSVAARKA